jgi:hypothetical protein
VLVNSDNTGGSTSSTTNADVVVVSGLSIPTTHAVKVMFTGYLNNNSGALRQGGFGFEVNSTELYAPLVVMIDDGTFPGVANMSAEITIPPHDGNMDHGGTFDWVSYRTDTGGITSGAEGQRVLCKDAALPNATISSLTVRGRVTGADCELVIDHIRVWELPD